MKRFGIHIISVFVFTVSLLVITSRNVAAETVLRAADVEKYIAQAYDHIDFKGSEKLHYSIFEKAYKGYLNLLNARKLNPQKHILTVVDFNLSSRKKRLWVFDLENNKLLLNDYVAHGQGSGDEYATHFSNVEDSHQSSLGFYVTTDIYNGDHGASLRLIGLDNGFNSAAFDRDIVIHGAAYVCAAYIKSQKRLGRSWGCPAVSNQVVKKLITTIEQGTCLFIYAKDRKYLAKSTWLNKKIECLPEKGAWAMHQLALKDTLYVYDVSAADIAPQGATIVNFKEEEMITLQKTLPIIWRLLP